jgi:thiosulfate/3-mercaptopyruvate sulfurtransferase
MRFTTLISVADLQAAIAASAKIRIIDCSFDLAAPQAGRAAYTQGHIPGAVYANLDADLSGPKTGTNGRHPLPARADFALALARLGVDNDTQIVAYDANAGIYAARLWWMARWAGHRDVAVLDGGLDAWKQAGLSLASGVQAGTLGSFSLREPLVRTVDYAQVRANLESGADMVLDARAPDRFRGENETMDPVGGHIPGARNRFFKENLTAQGTFKPAAELRAAFAALAQGRDPATLVNQCGSGVTACHNMLALELAGLTGSKLYPGSWSEWSAQPGAPIATGIS